MKSVLKHTFILWIILFIGCEDEKPKEEVRNGNLFILCEGNYGSANASLWSVDLDDEAAEINANVYESLTNVSLGDVANAMYIHNDLLYIINNNSHSLEILGLGENITYLTRVDLSTSSPRYMAFSDDKGYITTWYNGILILDLNSNFISDTISINGMPEDIIYDDENLYVSVPMNSDWSTNDDILKIDVSSQAVIDTFDVVAGPERLLISDNKLFVASTYYDLNWNSYSGTSAIELSSGTIQTNDYGMSSEYGSDLVEIDGSVFRATTIGIAPLNSDLSVDNNRSKGDFSGVYSVVVSGDKIIFGVTDDYLAPDQVFVTDLEGNILRTFEVGAIPTDFAVYEK